jgi:hypothetical protein
MIIGSGDIAHALEPVDCPGWTWFASGVSNSKEKRLTEYHREVMLLSQQPQDKHLVYFSSLGVFYQKSPYLEHKRKMEELVKRVFKVYTIVRIGNITWGTNPHTLINHLRNRHKAGKKLTIEDVYRYVINQDEFIHWMKLVPEWCCEMNITGRRMKVKDIVNEYVYG